MPNEPRPQNAPHRQTEGGFVSGREQLPAVRQAGASRVENKRKPGRPAGSKNKPKGILPKELASSILLEMKDMLPREHYDYMVAVVRDGKAISVERELDTMILLLGRNLYPALVLEGKAEAQESAESFFDDGDEGSDSKPQKTTVQMPTFRKDVTERLKVWAGLLAQKDKIERSKDDSDKGSTVLKIVSGRGIDQSRLRVLVGVESRPMVGDPDPTEQPANEARTVSDQVSERFELLPAGEQDEADRV